ncbi:hypothetical protein [Sphingopyxis sp. 22461]|uniref:hypothetical protein n=1 Tax=Sphingopyxis sp. 22461 TaxID=3453923 RepID=UPI003F850BF8
MLFAMALALLAQPTDENDVDIRIDNDRTLEWSSGPWRIFPYPEEQSCDLGYSAPNDEYWTVAYSARVKAVRLLITNKKATSVEAGRDVRLTILFLRNSKLSAEWPNTTFETHVVRGGERAFVSEPLALEFLDEFAKADFVGVMTDKAAVAGASLSGSAEAIGRLRNCAFTAAGLNADDPFLK